MMPTHQEFYAMTDIDQYITLFHVGPNAAYAYSISDRNDYGIMAARSTLARLACRATRNRVMHQSDEA